MRFLRLKLDNWKNFTKVDVPLGRRVFVAGPNAAGKSNLLDAFRFLHDLVVVGGGLQSAVAKRGGVSKLRCLAARRYPDVGIAIELGDEHEAPEWTYTLVFNQDNNRRTYIKREEIFHHGKKIKSRPDREDDIDKERLQQTHLEQVSANKNFRDIADFLRGVRYLHIVPQLVRDPDRSLGRPSIGDPFGAGFIEQIATTSPKTLASRLKRIEIALRIAVPQLRELAIERDERGVPHLKGRFEHWRPHAGWQREDQFSDGTLRLLGLLWAVLDGTGPILLEEPELSLHPAVVRYIPQMITRVTQKSRRQIVISTHSPDLLADRSIGGEETLLLKPYKEGTSVSLASDNKKILALLRAGQSIADAALPLVAPARPEQLLLFDN